VIAISGIVSAYGLYLAAIGPELERVNPGDQSTAFVNSPNPAGIALFLFAVSVIAGLSAGTEKVAWFGAALIAASGLVFVFSFGGVLLPLAALLIAALALRRIAARRRSRT
jgi:hypothetical protein